MSTRIIFMGSPDFALPSLKALLGKYDLVGVFTQPDKPTGRGRVIGSPPVKELATQLGLSVFQPVNLKDSAILTLLQTLKPELIVVVAYGKILTSHVLDIPKFGCINVHASLLPRWRGASPIQAAILAGDSVTGVTIMKLGLGLDDGPILAQKTRPILPEDTAGSLSDRLSALGADLLMEILPKYINGTIDLILQDENLVTLAPRVKKEDGLLDFSMPAEILSRKVRAFSPWPTAYFLHDGQSVRIFKAQPSSASTLNTGQLGRVSGNPAIGTSRGDLVILELQYSGKKKVSGNDFLHGARNWG